MIKKKKLYPIRRPIGGISSGMLMFVAFFGCIALVALWVSQGYIGSERWSIKWVKVAGEFKHISTEQIRAVAADHVGGGFFAVDLDAIKLATESVAWVQRAEVKKTWPDTIEVTVYEQFPLASWGEHHLMNREGEVFEVEEGFEIKGLPRLKGPENLAVEVLENFLLMRTHLLGSGLDIRQAQMNTRGSWKLILNNSIELRLGASMLFERLSRFNRAYPDIIARSNNSIAYADLRYTNGLAVGWNDE